MHPENPMTKYFTSPTQIQNGESGGWLIQARFRIAQLRPLKAIGTTAFILLFFWGYFGVMRNPWSAPTMMPLTIIDESIPFTPLAFGFYASLWLYVSLPPALLLNVRQLLAYGFWIGALCVFCLLIFLVWPTTIPEFDINWSKYPTIKLIKGLDISGNACPSLHVATAVFSAVWIQHILRLIGAPRVLSTASIVLCVLIVWSTIALRQHVAIDALAGIAVGLIFSIASLSIKIPLGRE